MGRGNEEAADGVFQRVVALLVGEGASKALELFLRVMVWGGDRKRAGEDHKVEEVTEYVVPLWSTSIHLARYNSNYPNGNDHTRAYPIVRSVFLST